MVHAFPNADNSAFNMVLYECGTCYQIARFRECCRLFLLHFGVPVVPLIFSYSWCVFLGF